MIRGLAIAAMPLKTMLVGVAVSLSSTLPETEAAIAVGRTKMLSAIRSRGVNITFSVRR